VFACGALCDAGLLRVILGAEAPVPETATLSAYKAHWSQGERDFSLLPAPERQVAGALLQGLNALQLARLTFFEESRGRTSRRVRVRHAGQDDDVLTFLNKSLDTSPGEAPIQGDMEYNRDLMLLVAKEIMTCMGRISAEQMVSRRSMIQARAAARLAARQSVPADVRCDLSAENVEVLSEDAPHSGFFVTKDYTLRHPQFSGGKSAPVRREVFVATDAAIVLPYDPKRDRVLLVEQFRMGPFGRGDPKPWMLEPVAGRVDVGETPDQTAIRECQEEAGLHPRHLEHIASHYCSPGCSTEYFHCFLGICDLPDMIQGAGGLETEHEDIRTHVLSYEAAMGLLKTGEANNGPLILSLIWLSRERDRLRASA